MKIRLTRRSIPLLLLGVLLLSFGVQLPSLGFYWDDWIFVHSFNTNNLSGMWDFASYYRPLSAWFYYLTVPLLGTTPLNWQIFALVLRWLTAWGMWAVLCKLWPQRWREAAWMGLLFAVYPTFLQQAIAVTYSHHYVSYLLYFVSLWLMIHALQNERQYWTYTFLGVVTQILHLTVVEYFVTLEVIRPVFIWVFFAKEVPQFKQRAIIAAKKWFPYLLVLILFVLWRLFVVEYSVEDPNAITIISAVQEDGLKGVLEYLQVFVRNLLDVLITSWFGLVKPDLIDFQSRSGLLAWFFAGLTALGLWFVMRPSVDQSEVEENNGWVKQAALLGLLAAVLGLVPGWVTGFDSLVGRYGDRVTLPAMFGASMLLAALVFGRISSQRTKVIILSLLVGLSVAHHFRITNDYRWDWVRQRRAYWQIYWRAPGLKEGASLATDGALTTYANRYSSGMAVNMLYNSTDNSDGIYLFEYFVNGIYSNLDRLAAGNTLTTRMRSGEFVFDLNKSIFLLKPRESGQCYWFLNSRDVYYTKLPQEIRVIIPYLDLDNILPEPTNDNYPPKNIFGPEEIHGWCYYFQKADLARQYAEWDTVLDLYEIARENNFSSDHGYEILPFLEANLALENWDEATRLTRNVAVLEKDSIRGVVCSMWLAYSPEDMENQEFLEAQEALENLYACSSWQE